MTFNLASFLVVTRQVGFVLVQQEVVLLEGLCFSVIFFCLVITARKMKPSVQKNLAL